MEQTFGYLINLCVQYIASLIEICYFLVGYFELADRQTYTSSPTNNNSIIFATNNDINYITDSKISTVNIPCSSFWDLSFLLSPISPSHKLSLLLFFDVQILSTSSESNSKNLIRYFNQQATAYIEFLQASTTLISIPMAIHLYKTIKSYKPATTQVLAT